MISTIEQRLDRHYVQILAFFCPREEALTSVDVSTMLQSCLPKICT